MSALAPLMEAFFTDRLITQRGASANTITGYRDTFRLLLGFATGRTGKKPSGLDIADLDAPLIAAFLDHLEHERGNSVRTRNNRLAAIHSLFGYAALRHPEHAAFPTRTGTRMSRDAVEHRLSRHLEAARAACPSLRAKRVGMHTLRHSAAMRLLEAGTDATIIALWLGHEQPATPAQIYLHVDMSQKQRAIARVAPPGTSPGRYRPPDPLLAFLEAL